MMIFDRKFRSYIACACFAGFLLGAAPAQQASSLGDLARHVREQKQNAAPAKVMLTEDTLPRRDQVNYTYCVTKPCYFVKVSAAAPGEAKSGGGPKWYGTLKNGHQYWFGFSWQAVAAEESDSYLEAAKQSFLLTAAPRDGDFTGKAKVLFAEDTQFEGRPALLISFQGGTKLAPQRGTALFIAAPYHVLTVRCSYLEEDVSDAAARCGDFVRSTQLTIPKQLELQPVPDEGEDP